MNHELLIDTLAIEYMKQQDISALSPTEYAEKFKNVRESIDKVLEIPVGCKTIECDR